jgi:nicotinamide mononucleotide transporter
MRRWSRTSFCSFPAVSGALAGLQASYLVFGVHGLLLWRREHRRDHLGRRFNEAVWYQIGWILSLRDVAYTVTATEFVDGWAVEFVIVSLALVANWATTRKWTWSWPVWLTVNMLQAVYFWHLGLWGQFGCSSCCSPCRYGDGSWAR